MSSIRVIKWKKLNNFKSISAFIVATSLGAGLFPIAPGTMGALVAVPLAYFTAPLEWPIRFLIWFGLIIIGTWSAKIFDETMQSNDNQNIVIDEVVGLGITAWTAGQNLTTLVVAFALFRFFDIVKPPPVRQIDTWSKKQNSPWWGGFGVIADDVVAGFQGLAVILFLQYLNVLK